MIMMMVLLLMMMMMMITDSTKLSFNLCSFIFTGFERSQQIWETYLAEQNNLKYSTGV